MFSWLMKGFKTRKVQQSPLDAESIAMELTQLESAFEKMPMDKSIQKEMIIKYSQAIKVFSSDKKYSHYVDDIFIKVDKLRNTIRQNI